MINKGKRHTYKREEIIDIIIKMRIEKGATYLTIRTFLKEKFGYEQAFCYELLRNAKQEINDRSIQLFGEDLKEDIERFENLLEQALIDKDKKEARENLKEIAKLKGHYVERTDITSNGKDITEIKLIHINGKDVGNKND